MGVFLPSFMDDMAWRMAEVYGAITDQILINLAHYFPYFDESKLPGSSFAYQADMLAHMGQINRKTIEIIRRGLGDADEALQGVLNEAIIKSVGAISPELWDAAKKGVLQAPMRPVVSPEQMRAYSLYYKQAAEKMNLVNTVMLESTKQAYQATVSDIVSRVENTSRALDIAAGETVTGVSTWNQATQHAIDRLKQNGITGFVDHAGRQWSAEAYVAMDVRTTVANTARAAVWETNENFGNDLYQVSYHDGARPLCYPWQNKVISATDNTRTVYDLDGNEIEVIAQSATSYGEAAGLFGVNCKHYPTPFIPGVSVIRGTPQDEAANAKSYAESQEQRRLERKLREQKRDVLMEKTRGAPQEVVDALNEKCRNTSKEIQDFCDSTGRARHRDRESVYTKREFPDKSTYDVAKFVNREKEFYDSYWGNDIHGTQAEYRFDTKLHGGKARDAYTLADAKLTQSPWTVNPGSTSEIQLAKADIYEMPDGVKFVFKHGMSKANQTMNPDDLVAQYYNMPKELRGRVQKTVTVVDRYNPADAYWRKRYKNFTHSYATGGDEVVFYKHTYAHDYDYILFTFEHEGGHMIDRQAGILGKEFSELYEWTDAVAKDKLVSGLDSMRAYGKNSPHEDFADSIAYYFTDKTFKTKMPNRAALIERILGIGGTK